MTTFYDKLVHLVGEGGWQLSEHPSTGAMVIEWHRPGNPPSIVAVNAVSDAQAKNTREDKARGRAFANSKKDKTLIAWIAAKHGLATDEALAELKTIWDAL